MAKSYKDLDIFKIPFDLFISSHKLSLQLPKYELFELGSQIRRSSDFINSNIVEAYGRKRYQKDFIKFLIYSHSSNDETINHFKKIKTLYPQFDKEVSILIDAYDLLGGKIHNFIEYIINNWKT